MSNAGIDYGMGRSNVDVATGIRFGVISCNSVSCEALSDVEYDYGDPCCPKCGGMALASGDLPEESENWEIARGACSDWGCDTCEYVFDSSEAYGDEAIGWKYEADGYQLADCLENDVMVLASSFYTFAQYCSPCVPGAGNLDNPIEDGAKTYCLGHDWFEEGKAPYPVFSVETGAEVHPT